MKREQIIDKIKSTETIIDSHSHVGLFYNHYINNFYPYCLSFEDLVVRMKYLGIGRSVVFPMGSSYYTVDTVESKEVSVNEQFSTFPYEIENRNLLREVHVMFEEYSDMAIPFVMFDPSRKVTQQVEAIEELCHTYPVFGLKTVTTYIQSFLKDLETTGKPIMDLAAKYDLPIIMHTSYHKDDPWAQASDAVEIAAAHPEIRICLAHSVRFIKSVLDKAAQLPNCFVDVAAFDIHCQLAVQNSQLIPPPAERFEADYEKPSSVLKKLISEYPDTIVWGTDTPFYYFMQDHYDAKGNLVVTQLQSRFDTEMRILKELSEDEIKLISYKNTLRYLFG